MLVTVRGKRVNSWPGGIFWYFTSVGLVEFFGILPQLAWWNFLVFYLSWPGGIFWYFTSVGLVEFFGILPQLAWWNFLVFYHPAFHQVSLTTSTPHPTPIHQLFCQRHYLSPLSTWPSDYVLSCFIYQNIPGTNQCPDDYLKNKGSQILNFIDQCTT